MTHAEQIRDYDESELAEFFDDIVIDVENRVKPPWEKWYALLTPEDRSSLQIITDCDMICAWLASEVE